MTWAKNLSVWLKPGFFKYYMATNVKKIMLEEMCLNKAQTKIFLEAGNQFSQSVPKKCLFLRAGSKQLNVEMQQDIKGDHTVWDIS